MTFYNEFFTPSSLIEKMLSHIPTSLWNTETTWLEPTCGDGGFMIAIFHKLFNHSSYANKYPDTEERKQCILKNLYMVDINPINVEKTRQYFGNCQIFCEDFLTWKCDIFFDVIVGNPPFQTPSTSYLNGSMRKGTGKKMYEKIIDKSLTMLKERGHACFVSPLNLWAGKGCLKNTLYEKITTQYYPKYIYLNNVKKQWFPRVGQNLKMCFFVISKEKKGKTLIENNDGNEYEIELNHINPVEEWTPDNIELLNTYVTEKNWFLRTSDKNRLFKEGDYKLIQNPERIFSVEPTTDLLKESQYGIEKLILFRMKPFALGMYDKGTLLLSSQIYFLPLTNYSEEEKKNIIAFYKSDIYKKMVKITTTSQFLKCGIFIDIDKISKQMEQLC